VQNFTDVFISYGRKESKVFASKIYENLVANGYTAWFDQNDIPIGVDYQNQIDDGIEKAHTFIFIIAPHSVASPYCRLEIELAAKHCKRIIPILHVEGFEFEKLHPIIGKINWIYSRQVLPEKETSWENATEIDSIEKCFTNLITILEQHKSYVHKHTELLYAALEWERNQQVTQYLLVGKERQEAEKWLLTEFKAPIQAPCEPSDLHASFICESKKNANNLMTEVFICAANEKKTSNASTDIQAEGEEIITPQEQMVRSVLAKHCITTWQHHTDIQKGEDTEKSILQGIEQADNFLFFISHASIVSEQCLKELEYAALWKKRIIPLLMDEIPTDKLPKEIQNLHAINFIDNKDNKKLVRQELSDFEKDINELLKEIQTDATYHNQHKVFLTQALKWQRNHKNSAFLLQGYNLQNAQTFLATGKSRNQHQATRLHKIFVAESVAKIGQLGSEVFISYSRTDGDFARKLNNELQLLGKSTWFDQESIATGADFQKEINKGIENSDNFLFIISDKSLESPFCVAEVNYAAKLNKRIVTILNPAGLQHIEMLDQYPSLSKVQWIDFRKKDFEKAFFELINTLNSDREYIHLHTKYTQKANDWLEKNRSEDLLLQGESLLAAKNWIEEAEKLRKKPSPTQALRAYIGAGELAWFGKIEKEKQQKEREEKLEKEKIEALENAIALQKRSAKRQKYFTFAALLLAGIAIWGYGDAYFSQREVEKQSKIAYEKAKEAAAEKLEAEQNAAIAKKNAKEAEIERMKAEQAVKEVKAQRNATEEQRKLALQNLEKAKLNEEKANLNLELAQKAREIAILNLKKSIESEAKARISEEKAKEALAKSNKLISFFGFGEEDRAWAYKDGKFALIDKQGKQFSDFIYGNPSDFEDSVALVELDNDYAVVNLNGDTITSGYEFFIRTNNNTIYTKKNNQYGFVDRKGKLLPNTEWFDNNWLPDAENGVAWIQKNTLWGLADKNGKVLLKPEFNDKMPFQHGLAKVKKGNLMGVVNNSGTVILAPMYENISFFSPNCIQVGKNNKKGLFDGKGNIVLATDYDEIVDFDSATVLIHKNNLWGIANKNGAIITPPSYEEIKNFTKQGLVDYEKNGRWGIVDDKGREIIIAQFEDIQAFSESGLAAVKQNGKWGFINQQGKVIVKPHYTDFQYILPNYIKVKENNLFGLLDINGKTLLETTYDNIDNFDKEFVLIHKNNLLGLVSFGKINKLLAPEYQQISRFSPDIARIQKDGKWGFINKQLKVVVVPQFDELFDFSNKIARYQKAGKYGFVYGDGKLVSNILFEDAYDFYENIAAVKIADKWTFIDNSGKTLISPQFEKVYAFSEGLAGVKQNGKWGFFSAKSQKIVTAIQFTEVGNLQTGLATVILDNKWGYVDTKGKVLVTPIFDWAEEFNKNVAVVRVQKNGKIGYINRAGVLVLLPQFDTASNFIDGFAYVKKSGKFGILSTNGQLIVSPKYDEIKPFSEKIAAVRIDEKWGFINEKGELIIATQFDSVESFSKGRAIVSQYGETFLINTEGKMALY
jgi:hypothetical protein